MSSVETCSVLVHMLYMQQWMNDFKHYAWSYCWWFHTAQSVKYRISQPVWRAAAAPVLLWPAASRIAGQTHKRTTRSDRANAHYCVKRWDQPTRGLRWPRYPRRCSVCRLRWWPAAEKRRLWATHSCCHTGPQCSGRESLVLCGDHRSKMLAAARTEFGFKSNNNSNWPGFERPSEV